jgi:hypothetical protein
MNDRSSDRSNSDSPSDEWPYRIFSGGTDHGIYWGRDAKEVRDVFAQAEGYDDYDAYADARGDHVWVRQWHWKVGAGI